MFYHVKFEVIGKYFLSCKLIFVLEKERKILLCQTLEYGFKLYVSLLSFVVFDYHVIWWVSIVL